MPRNLPRHAYCAAPGVAKSHKNFDGLLGLIISFWFSSKVLTIAAFLAILVPLIIWQPCLSVIPFIIVIVSLLEEAKQWYYHERLLCVRDSENCVVGSVLHQPEVSFDGDRKMDLLLAPFTEPECFRTIATHLKDNKGLLNDPALFNDAPFFNGTPVAGIPNVDPGIIDDPSQDAAARKQARDSIAAYLKKLRSEDPNDEDATSNIYNNFMVGFMARLLDPQNVDKNGNPKNFQGHYYRKDESLLGVASPLWNAIPRDYDAGTNWFQQDSSISPLKENNPYEVQYQPRGLNPMFRFDGERLLPYLHCEIDGNYVAVLLDQLSLTLVSFGIAYTFVCMTPLGPLGGLLIGALFAALVFLLQWLLDGGSDAGEATAPGVDYDDPDNFGVDGQQLDGDLVGITGPWIMDTEHTQYFEIHPVKAYYILARNGRTGEVNPYDSNEERDKSLAERLTNESVTKEMRDKYCEMIRKAESEDMPSRLEKDEATLLSYGLNTFYGGGGIEIN